MLEDVQLQCELAAEKQAQALQLGESLADGLPSELAADFGAGLEDLAGWRQRTLSYVYHLRETNLTTIVRHCLDQSIAVPDGVLAELDRVLQADMGNQGQAEPCAAALALLHDDLQAFAKTYFVDTAEDKTSRGVFTVTSR